MKDEEAEDEEGWREGRRWRGEWDREGRRMEEEREGEEGFKGEWVEEGGVKYVGGGSCERSG